MGIDFGQISQYWNARNNWNTWSKGSFAIFAMFLKKGHLPKLFTVKYSKKIEMGLKLIICLGGGRFLPEAILRKEIIW